MYDSRPADYLQTIVAFASAADGSNYRGKSRATAAQMEWCLLQVMNEGIIKRLVQQDRPSGSCLHSKGMPSSHAELSVAFWFYGHLEVCR